MARIRTVKPEFFLHEGLFDLEQETGWPMRIAFQGLWCQADREGRFCWQPRKLKSQVCPYDECDFSRVLDALATRGFLVKYACQGVVFGWIPSFKNHQVINNKESASKLPSHDASDCELLTSTRGPRDDHAFGTLNPQEGKGKEGKGKEQIPPKVPQGGRTGSAKKRHPAFQEFWKAYPRKTGPDAAYRAWKRAGKRIRVEHDLETEGAIARMLEAAQAFAESDLGQDKKFCPHASTWLNGGRYDDDRAEWVRVEESARPGTKDYSLTDFLDGDA